MGAERGASVVCQKGEGKGISLCGSLGRKECIGGVSWGGTGTGLIRVPQGGD